VEIIVFVSARTDCRPCQDAEEVVEEVLRELGMLDKVSFRKLTVEAPEAAKYGVMVTPSVVVDGQMVTNGAAPDPGRLADFLCGTLG
jgi:predicted thioredoxin/glutaredoxin